MCVISKCSKRGAVQGAVCSVGVTNVEVRHKDDAPMTITKNEALGMRVGLLFCFLKKIENQESPTYE